MKKIYGKYKRRTGLEPLLQEKKMTRSLKIGTFMCYVT